MTAFIYLASQSPRRSQLLDQIGVAHTLLLPSPEEDAEALEWVRPGETPMPYVPRGTALNPAASRARVALPGRPGARRASARTPAAPRGGGGGGGGGAGGEAMGELAAGGFGEGGPRRPPSRERIQKRATTLVAAQPFFCKW